MSSFATELIWRVSSKSNGKECVEVGQRQAAVLVRDTKNRDCGLLTFPSTAWKDFIKQIALLPDRRRVSAASGSLCALAADPYFALLDLSYRQLRSSRCELLARTRT